MIRSYFRNCLLKEFQTHPLSQKEDVLKFAYQAAYGAEHLLKDRKSAEKYFHEEWDSVLEADGEPLQDLADQVLRVHFAQAKRQGYDEEALLEAFIQSASVSNKNGDSDFMDALKEISSMINDDLLPFTLNEWNSFLEAYYAQGGGAIHHSEIYRSSYHPAYRVLSLSNLSD